MRVLLAPDSFGGTLTAAQAASALAAGWRRVRPSDDVVDLPLSDGGPGFLDCLPGVRISVLVEDPLARPTAASFLLDGTTAYVESAEAAGLHLLDPAERDPRITTTYGVGQLIVAAADAGATTVVVGLGGTATNDGGAGLLAALGVSRLDMAGMPVKPGGAALGSVDRLEGSPRSVALVAATDVTNPLLGPDGASHVFGPQKGATDVDELDQALTRWADLLEGHLGVKARGLPGAGAGGGLGFALLALGATRRSGLDVVAEAVGLSAAIESCDLVITGEGRLDGTSVRGKVVGGVCSLAASHGVPCVAVAGQVVLGRREAGAAGLAQTWSLIDEFGRDRAFHDAAGAVTEVAASVAQAWGV